jgi:hypothetical protein
MSIRITVPRVATSPLGNSGTDWKGFVLGIIGRHAAEPRMAVGIGLEAASLHAGLGHDVGLAQPCVHELVIGVHVGRLPVLPVALQDAARVVEHLEVAGERRLQRFERIAEPVIERLRAVVEVEEDQPRTGLAPHLAQPAIGHARAVGGIGLAARDVGAPATAVIGPVMEEARHVLGIAAGLVDQPGAAVRAHIDEAPDPPVISPDDQQRRVDPIERTEIEFSG